MTNSAVEVHDLTRRYGGDHEAVRRVSFRVDRGELFALLGTNGAGKTSLLELVSGLGRPSGGSVRVLGHDPYRNRRAVRPRVGVMVQESGFPGDLTAAEAATMWAGTLSEPREVGEVLTLVGLAHRAGVRVKQLSGGERRRLDLALALLGRPELLLLDEPTTGLDPEGRRDTWQLVRDLLRDGVTVLLTTHYLQEAQELADRLAIMREGRIVASGSVSEVVAARPARIRFTLPAHLTAADLPPALRPAPGAAADGPVTVHTGTLQPTLTELLRWADAHDVVLGGLEARPASLEEAFLAIAAEAPGARS